MFTITNGDPLAASVIPSRRSFLGASALAFAAAAVALQACAPNMPAPATSAAPAPAAGAAGLLQDFADAVSFVLPKMGLGGGTLAQITGDLGTLAGIVKSLQGGASFTATMAQNGSGIITAITDALSIAGIASGPYGMLITAGLSLLPEIAQLAGIGGARLASVRLPRSGVTVTLIDAGEARAALRRIAGKPA